MASSWILFFSVQAYYTLTPWSRVLLEKITGFSVSQEIPHIYMEIEGSLPQALNGFS